MAKLSRTRLCHKSPQAHARLVFAADLGGTHLRVALIDESGKIHKQLKRESPKGDQPDCVINALAAAAKECGCNPLFAEGQIIAASIMVPGTVDIDNAVVLRAPNLSCLDSFGLKAALQGKFGVPVVLENDANAAAIGEMWLGAARGCRDVICVTLGTGVGGGVILNGKVWRGAEGSAGEIGHATVDPFGGLKCKCGNTGCLEMFASATAIVRMARENLPRFEGSPLSSEQLTAERVCEAGRQGDALALAIFKRVGMYLGVGLANLINLFRPEIIVIGGGVANGWDLFGHDLEGEVAKRVFGAKPAPVKIVPAECGDSAGLVGAARLAFDEGCRDKTENTYKSFRSLSGSTVRVS